MKDQTIYKDSKGNIISYGDKVQVEIIGVGSGTAEIVMKDHEPHLWEISQGYYPLSEESKRRDMIITIIPEITETDGGEMGEVKCGLKFPTDNDLAVEVTARFFTNGQYKKQRISPILKTAFIDGSLWMQRRVSELNPATYSEADMIAENFEVYCSNSGETGISVKGGEHFVSIKHKPSGKIFSVKMPSEYE